MYIIVEQHNYDEPRIIQAHAQLEHALAGAEKLLGEAVDPWDKPRAVRGLNDARDIGPAMKPVAVWDVYDQTTYTIYEIVVSST